MSTVNVETAPVFTITLTLEEAQELLTGINLVYGMKSDLEFRLCGALPEGRFADNPFEAYHDEQGDLCVRRVGEDK